MYQKLNYVISQSFLLKNEYSMVSRNSEIKQFEFVSKKLIWHILITPIFYIFQNQLILKRIDPCILVYVLGCLVINFGLHIRIGLMIPKLRFKTSKITNFIGFFNRTDLKDDCSV